MTDHGTTSMPGPLVVSATNPRYFTPSFGPAAGRAVYLTGSHIWNNLHDGMGPGADAPKELERFDFDAYLRFLVDRGHNFIRLWRWEQIRSQAAGGGFHLNMTPQPWLRTGPGEAKDGRPRFDLERLDPAFFSRLRQRVAAAGEAGIYVGVMLFDGWALHLSPPPDHIEGHPFHGLNNINAITVTSIDDLQVLPLHPRIQAIQDTYIRAMVDALHDLPNVLWEVANESSGNGSVDREFAALLGMPEPPQWGDSTQWQYRVIEVVKGYEKERGHRQHPIGMTMQFPVADQTMVNAPLLRSRAEWISPGYDDEVFADGLHPMAPDAPPARWFADPPPADGQKVIITDTDHYAPGKADPLWAWTSFLRGHHPILMDFGLIGGPQPAHDDAGTAGVPPFEAFEPTRYAMGDTRRFAERVDLINMAPGGDLTSTGYALVNPGNEYLVLEPAGSGTPFTVDLSAGHYAVEWFTVHGRQTIPGDAVTVDTARTVQFTAPAPNGRAIILYLRAIAP